MKTALATIVFGALAAAPEAWAQPASPAREWAEQQYTLELANCAVFYVMCAEHQRRRGNIENARTSGMLADLLLDRAIEIEPEDVVMAQAKITLRRWRAEVKADPDSIHLIVEQHGQACWNSWKDKEARFAYWLENWEIGP